MFLIKVFIVVLTGGRLDPPTVTVAEIEMRDTSTTQHTMTTVPNNTQPTMTTKPKTTQPTMTAKPKTTQPTMTAKPKTTQPTTTAKPKNQRGNKSLSDKQGN